MLGCLRFGAGDPEAARPVPESRQVVAVLGEGGSVLGRAGGQSVDRRTELLADLVQAVVGDSGRLPVLTGEEEGRVAEDEVLQRSPPTRTATTVLVGLAR
ncbi:hypothetical protein GCM10020295_25720 [Streptomyces cinereospinus]